MNSNAKIDLDSLRVIESVAEHGSFSAAAVELHRVTSTISYTVAKLESAFDVKFFERKKSGVELTEAGREVLRHSRHLLQAADDAERSIERMANGWESEITIAVGDLINQEALLPLVAGLLEQSPKMQVTIRTEVLNGLWDSLATNRADLLIGVDEKVPEKMASVDTCDIGPMVFIFTVAANHPLANVDEPLSYEDVRKYHVVAVADTSRNMPNRSIGLLQGQSVITVSNHQLKVEAQRRGIGIGTLPEVLARPYLESGELVVKATELNSLGQANLQCAWKSTHKGKGLQWLTEQLQLDEVKQQLLDLKL